MHRTERSSAHEAQRGLSLVEMLVAVAIVGVLLAVAIPSMSNFMERRRVIAVAGELSGIVAYAKSESNSITDGGISIHLESTDATMSCAAVVTQTMGDDCRCYHAPNQICPTSGRLLRLFQLPRSDGVSFTATASPGWQGLSQVMTFNRRNHSQAEQGVRLTVTGTRTGIQLRVDINQTGRISICSPVDRVGGYPTCA